MSSTGLRVREVLWFSYHAENREARHKRDLHQVRDGAAFAEFMGLLLHPYLRAKKCDFHYAGMLFNLPDANFRNRRNAPHAENLVVPKVTPAHILVLPTRPPIHDPVFTSTSPRILRSETDLEKNVFYVLEEFFLSRCSRKEIALREEISSAVEQAGVDVETPARFRQRRSQHGGPTFVNPPPGRELHTAAYLAFVPAGTHVPDRKCDGRMIHGWRNGPAILAAWGMSGIETLCWYAILARQFGKRVIDILCSEQAHFVMGEFASPEISEREVSSHFARELACNIKFEVACDTGKARKWSVVHPSVNSYWSNAE